MRALAAALLFALAGTTLAQIPLDADRYRRDLIRNARVVWGLTAPTATFGAQIAQESAWRPDAVSHVGARGLAQFMPATADWIAGLYDDLADNEPHNPAWAIRALVRYDKHLWDRVDGAVDDCERMAMTLAGYNGGPGWVVRDRALAESKGLDPARWFGSVETVNAGRARWAWDENRGYPRRILHTLEPRYAAAGWGIKSC